jgi:hypothetical protein
MGRSVANAWSARSARHAGHERGVFSGCARDDRARRVLLSMSVKRISSEEYELARVDLARQFRLQFDRMVDVYDVIEPMISRKSYRIPREKLRGLGKPLQSRLR